MDLSIISQALSNGLTKLGWQTVVEDDYPDFEQLACQNPAGPLRIFTRLDVLIMTPEKNPIDASGACLFFLFYADPSRVADMFHLGRTIRQNDSHLFRSQCESVFNAAHIVIGSPSVKVTARPKHEKIKFSDNISAYPAFMVEISYWLNSDKLPSKNRNDHKVVHTYASYDHIRDARIEAIYALRGADFHETEEILLNTFTDHDPQIRKAGLTVLIECCDDSCMTLIREALHDEDDEVRILAGEYFKAYRKRLRGCLRKYFPTLTVSECLDALNDKDDSVRYHVIQSLDGVTDPMIIEPLVNIIKNNNESISCRCVAVNTLEHIESPEVLNEFYTFLNFEKVGEHAAFRLAVKSNQLAQDLLIKALNSEDRMIRLSAASGVGSGSDPRTIQPLCQMIEGDDIQLRLIAIKSILHILSWLHVDEKKNWSVVLSEISETEHNQKFVSISAESREILLVYLKKLVCDPDDEVRGKALVHLSVIDKNLAVTIVFEELIKYISRVMNDNYNENIYTVFDDFTIDWVQYGLYDAISRLNEGLFCKPLGQLLRSKWWNVKVWAAKLLFILGDERGRSQLIAALDCEKLRVHVDSAIFLLSHGYKQAWDVLIDALTDKKGLCEDVSYVIPWFAIEWEIIDALLESEESRAIDLFISILNDADSYAVSNEAICRVVSKLGELGDPRAIEPIKKWQYKELINCDDDLDDLVEKALRKLNLVTG